MKHKKENSKSLNQEKYETNNIEGILLINLFEIRYLQFRETCEF